MKKIVLICSMCLTSLAYSQKIATPYIGLGQGFSFDKENQTYSTTTAEFGSWGIDRATTYGLTFDYVKNISTNTQSELYVGFKPYIYFFNKNSVSLFTYFMPKFKIPQNGQEFSYLFEGSFGANWELSPKYMLQYGCSIQTSGLNPYSPSVWVSINRLK